MKRPWYSNHDRAEDTTVPGEDIAALSDDSLHEKIERIRDSLRLGKVKAKDDNKKFLALLDKCEKEKAYRERRTKADFQAHPVDVTLGKHGQSQCDVQVIDDNEAAPSSPERSSLKSESPASSPGCHVVPCELSNGDTIRQQRLPSDVSGNGLVPNERLVVLNPNDLEDASPDLQDKVCRLCQKKLAAMTMDKEQSFCKRCRKKSNKSSSIIPTPSNKEASNGCSSQKQCSPMSGLRKGAIKAFGDTLDTAMDISDDEEFQADVVCSSSHRASKRQGLRSNSRRMAVVKLQYPSRSDPEAIEVQYADLRHLGPSEFLNDTVIDFYIKYIQKEKISDTDRLRCFYFFNSFFYKKLTMALEAKRDDCFEKLRKWTRGLNLFERSYLLMPIHDKAHWSLAIVCLPRGDGKICILHLDSMSQTSGHSSEVIFNVLKCYLAAEKAYLLGEHFSTDNAVCKRVQVPLQDNEWDCGLFMLYYIERFVQEAPVELEPSVLNRMFGRNWFKPSDASQLRELILKLLESLFDQECL